MNLFDILKLFLYIQNIFYDDISQYSKNDLNNLYRDMAKEWY